MSSFDLILHLSPAFHRSCSIRIAGDESGSASLEAPATGLLARLALTVPVAHAHMATLHERCRRMLAELDVDRDRMGLDGITVRGTFASTGSPPRAFSLWSPRAGSIAHAVIAAAFECFPFERGEGAELLEIMRSYFDLQPAATIVSQVPLRIRLAPWVHPRDAAQVEEQVCKLPADGDLFVDASGVERFHGDLARILPIARLLSRRGVVRWIVPDGAPPGLVRSGVEASMIDTVPPLPLSSKGEPVVLGDIPVLSDELIALARAGNKIAVVRAFRSAYPLTITEASQAADELLKIVAVETTSRG